MLLTLVLILLLIGAAVVGSIYSNFLVFYSNFNESENYHKAYYSSISALERAELVIKQRSPGYIGSGGWIMGKKSLGEGSITNGGSDGILSNFSYLTNDITTANKSTVFWNINSRASRIPATGKGDVEQMFAYKDSSDPNSSENSSNFNMMDYNYAQIFLLYYDNSGGYPYTKTKCDDTDTSPCILSTPKKITGVIRLPKKLHDNFGNLNTNESLVGKGIKDDVIVDWQIRGKYHKLGETDVYPFTIYSYQPKNQSSADYNKDSTIRETHINSNLNFKFSKDSKRSPTNNGKQAELTMISQKENEIKQSLGCNIVSDEGCLSNIKYFEKILTDTGLFVNEHLRFSLLNLLETEAISDGRGKKIYPFLEYYLEFPDDPDIIISDKYFTIDAQGNYGDYKIDKIIWRPTSKESILGNFTSVF